MTSGKETILFISQVEVRAPSLAKIFENEGYRCLAVDTVASALFEFQQFTPSVVIVDRMQDGIERLREHQALGIVSLVALCQSVADCTEKDCVDDLGRGFDLVVCNPSARELLARVRAILRRQQSRSAPSTHYLAGSLRMDLDRHEVTVHGKPVALTPKEFQILREILEFPSRVFTRQ